MPRIAAERASKQLHAFAVAVPSNNTSYGWQIEDNEFDYNWKAIRIAADQDHGIRPLPSSGEFGIPALSPHHHTIINNNIQNSNIGIELLHTEGTAFKGNHFSGNRRDIQEE
jgi:parallel beta-helix repeat protein